MQLIIVLSFAIKMKSIKLIYTKQLFINFSALYFELEDA